ncbi:hypothetical protein M0657_011236 [Pyricularia oryzae]|uniref:Uncharacterized protein n=2 Tax=Pyricularia oryzae TaxID=318829 RepID=A0AA97PNK1_PYRO3|nr:hypothetical protein OOU_Y34scaffold00292g2 [Pyricularia oryzae Y34]KAI7910454.1 hypothetical protein M9X92_011098 [Pyricularia oryzae]KAI7910796.1 hypothetical protein M0657_011236 [Pyricularia oryzae]
MLYLAQLSIDKLVTKAKNKSESTRVNNPQENSSSRRHSLGPRYNRQQDQQFRQGSPRMTERHL